MATLNAWDVVDANNNATPPDGWPENTMQYSEVNNTGRAVQGTLKRFFADINGSLNAGGVADAYTVTLNETGYVAYFDGMYFACSIPATNTGASTIDVNGIGVQSIVDRSGSPLTAGELQSGGLYEFRYDGTNFQLMGTIAGTPVLGSLVLTNSNPSDLVDTDVALNTGAADPDAATHLELTSNTVQAKGDATTVAALALNLLGGDLNLGAQSGTGGVFQWHNGQIRTQTATNNFNLRSDVAGDPTVPDNASIVLNLRDSGANLYASLGFAASTALALTNNAHGGNVRLDGETVAGAAASLLVADPDGGVDLYYTGNLIRSRTAASGSLAVRSDGNTDTENRVVTLEHQDGTDRALIGHIGSSALVLRNEIDSGDVVLQGSDAGSVLRNILTGDPTSGRSTLHAVNGGGWNIEHSASGHNAISTTSAGVDFTANSGATIVDAIALGGQSAIYGVRADSGGMRFRVSSAGVGAIIQTTAGGADEDTWATFTRNAGVSLHHNNIVRFATISDGVDINKDDNLDTGNLLVRWEHANGTTRLLAGLTGSAFDIRSLVHGANVQIRGEDTGGTLRSLIVADPDDDVALFDAGTEVARTLPAASGGFEVNNTSTGGGFERVLTTSDLAAGGAFEGATAAKTSGTQNIPSSTLTEPTLNFEEFDNGGWHSTSTNTERMTTISPYDRFHLWYSAGLQTLNDPGIYQWNFNGSAGNTWVGNCRENVEKVGTVNVQMQHVISTLANDDNSYFTGQNFQNSGVTQTYATAGNQRSTLSIQGFEV